MAAPTFNPSAMLLAQGANPTQVPSGAAMPPPPAPVPAGPAPSMDMMNSQAMLGLQGGAQEIPPNYEVEVQPNGTLALIEVDPGSGMKNIVRIVSAPKKKQAQLR